MSLANRKQNKTQQNKTETKQTILFFDDHSNKTKGQKPKEIHVLTLRGVRDTVTVCVDMACMCDIVCVHDTCHLCRGFVYVCATSIMYAMPLCMSACMHTCADMCGCAQA